MFSTSILSSTRLFACLCFSLAGWPSGIASEAVPERGKVSHATPCCLPFRFQAVVTPLDSFGIGNKVVTHLYRDWESKIQVHEQVTFEGDRIISSGFKTILDYNNMKQYTINVGACSEMHLTSGMLEPCMPDDAVYLGKSYIGLYDNTAHFDAWYFKRTNLNRDIEMTIAVTSDRCVPVMEHIVGTAGGAPANTLIVFSNVSEVVDSSVFTVPYECLGNSLM